jgi:DUF3096 family protein
LIQQTARIARGMVRAVQAEPRVANRHADPDQRGEYDMNLTVIHIGPLVALIAGILILIMPRLLNYIIAVYLIIVGIVGLVGMR